MSTTGEQYLCPLIISAPMDLYWKGTIPGGTAASLSSLVREGTQNEQGEGQSGRRARKGGRLAQAGCHRKAPRKPAMPCASAAVSVAKRSAASPQQGIGDSQPVLAAAPRPLASASPPAPSAPPRCVVGKHAAKCRAWPTTTTPHAKRDGNAASEPLAD